MQMDSYFSKHYSILNDIDISSEKSIQQWYKNKIIGYEKEFSSILSVNRNIRILEIGSGIGGLLNHLQKKGFQNIIGVDQSEEQLGICRKYITNDVIHSDGITYLEKTNEKYDLIFLIDLIEHLNKSEIIRFLKLILNSLSENGKLILRTPNMGSLTGNYSRYIDFTHEIGFTEESIFQVLRLSGFEKIKCMNSSIGKKRLLLMKSLHSVINKIYRIKGTKVYTPNLMIVAEK